MTRTRDEWRRVFRDFDPYRELTTEEFPTLYASRPRAASSRLMAAIEEATRPEQVRLLLAGARGSGKSTELLRLLTHLSRGEAVVLPLYVDVAAALPTGGTSLLGWLPVVALEVQAELARYPKARRTDGLKRALGALAGKETSEAVVGTFAALGALATAAADPTGATGALAVGRGVVASIAATRKVLDAIQANLAEGKAAAADREALVDSLAADLVALRDVVGLPVMLLLDGLDKLATVEEVRHALDDADLLYRMPGGLVLSSPLQLASDPQFAANLTPGRLRPVHLHNLPVVDHDGKPREEGIAVLRELFRLRWQATGLTGALVPDPLIDALARWSSGVVREFLELVRLAAQAARGDERDVVTEADVRAAVRERRMAYEFSLTTEDWDQLALVRASGERPTARLDELLFTNVVASYPNDGLWFRPNELLIPHLDARAARS